MTVEELYKKAKEEGVEKQSLYIDLFQGEEFDCTTIKVIPEMIKIDGGRILIEAIIQEENKMTVTDNRNKLTCFGALEYGDTFIYDKSVYVVLPAVKRDNITENAYNLDLEVLEYFDGDVLIEPVEVEIVIK